MVCSKSHDTVLFTKNVNPIAETQLGDVLKNSVTANAGTESNESNLIERSRFEKKNGVFLL